MEDLIAELTTQTKNTTCHTQKRQSCSTYPVALQDFSEAEDKIFCS